jgi:hypothetical protein
MAPRRLGHRNLGGFVGNFEQARGFFHLLDFAKRTLRFEFACQIDLLCGVIAVPGSKQARSMLPSSCEDGLLGRGLAGTHPGRVRRLLSGRADETNEPLGNLKLLVFKAETSSSNPSSWPAREAT